MKPIEAINDLWRLGFFEKSKSTADINSKIMRQYGTTTANITAVLNNCKEFLRKEGSGWIQRTRYEEGKNKNERYVNYFTLLDIHPRIQKVSKKLFLDGHYAQAILEAFKAVNNLVKQKSKHNELDGKNLMETVFSKNNPILAVNNNISTSDKDEQEGFMHLFAGAMLGIRNPKAHDNMIQRDMKVTYSIFLLQAYCVGLLTRPQKLDRLVGIRGI